MFPVLFKVGSFEVHSFGVLMALAFAGSILLAQWRAVRYGITRAEVGDCAFWALLAGVLGARLAFIVQDPSYFFSHPSELLSIQFRGLTSFGGLIFGAIAVLVWARKRGKSILSLFDLGAPSFVIGHAIGRIGCLLNGCCFGGICPPSLPWGIHVENSPFLHHPAQAYDTLMNLGVLGVLLWRERSNLKLGQLTGLMLILHGATRIIYEFWRAGTEEQVERNLASSTYWGSLPFTQAQAMAAGLVVAGVILLATLHLRSAVRSSSPTLGKAAG